MSGWDAIGVLIAGLNLMLAFLIAASIPKVNKAGGGAAAPTDSTDPWAGMGLPGFETE